MSWPAGWASPETVTAAVRKRWDRGELLLQLADALLEPIPSPDRSAEQHDTSETDTERSDLRQAGTALVSDGNAKDGWRFRVSLPGPSRDELADLHTEAGDWVRALRRDAQQRGWRLEERQVPSKLLGAQMLPRFAWFDSVDRAFEVLGEDARRLAGQFTDAVIGSPDPGDSPQFAAAWTSVLRKRPLQVATAPDVWLALLAVARWLLRNPRPGIPLREVAVPGVHTKLLEQNKQLARALFDAVLPADAVDTEQTNLAGRYGFHTGELEVLLAGPGALLGVPWLDSVRVTWPLSALAGLDPRAVGVRELVVVENKTSLARVPISASRVAVWGVGYAAEALAEACLWWDNIPVRYWGDIDTHGLRAYARVLRHHRGVLPLLMDDATLLTHRTRWGLEDEPATPEICEELLPIDQRELLAALRSGQWGARLRLEQEHLSAATIAAAFVDGG